MGSSYTWCNSIRVTPFLSRRFMRDPMDKNKTQLSITTLNIYLINSLPLSLSLLNISYVSFSLSLLSLSFHFLCNFSYDFTFLVFFSLDITFLILVLQNVQAKIFMAGAANGIRQLNEEILLGCTI